MLYTELSKRLRAFGAALDSVKPGYVRHYKRPPNLDGFIVWAEDTQDIPAAGDNSPCEMQMHVAIDYYTKVEYDPVVDALLGFLMAGNVYINSAVYSAVMYEDETGLIHHAFDCWVV